LSERAPDTMATRRTVVVRRFLPITWGEPKAAYDQYQAHVSQLGLRQGGVPLSVFASSGKDIAQWLELGAAAKRELACAPEGIRLDVIKNYRVAPTFLAAGCGYRATFVRDGTGALVVTSRVSIEPPAPRPGT